VEAPRFITHITSAGERWDLLAWQYYGDATLYSAIIMANPAVRIEPAFKPGLLIAVPILHKSPAATSNLPPWKRSQAD
jgi:phage tail protein X